MMLKTVRALQIFLFLSALFFSPLSKAKAQNRKLLDSLERFVKTTKVDSLRMQAYGDLCWNYGSIDFDKALYYGQEELKIAQKLNNQPAIALAYSDIGNTYTRVNKFNEALTWHIRSYELRDKLGLKAKAAGSISNIAVIYKQQGKYKEAIEYMTKSLRIYEDFGDEQRQALVLGNIGRLYMDTKNPEPARQAFERTLAIGKKFKSTQILSSGESGLLEYYFFKKQYTRALKQAKVVEALLVKLNNNTDLASVFNTVGQIYSESGKFPQAMESFNKALNIRLPLNDQLGIASCYKNIGGAYARINDMGKAEEYLKKAIAIFTKINAKDYLRDANETLAQVYEEDKQLGNSLAAFKRTVELNDSINSRETTDKINELMIKYETDKKADQIKILNKENKIQKLLVQSRNVTIGIIAGVLLLSIMAGFLFYNRYKLRQENKLQETVIKQQDLATRAVLIAEENERKRISGELHDGLGQMFSAVKMNLSGIADQLKFKTEGDREVFDKTLSLVDESCKEVRVISHQMAPNVLLKSGLTNAVRDFIDKIDARKLKVKLETFGLKERLEQNIETVLYRVIQETVNNVIKHAGANILDIQLSRDEEGVNVMIEDNGKGFDIAQIEKFQGIGLKNIRSRIAYLKGTVDFSSSPGNGTLVAIFIPIDGQ
ncbi:MAG: tetratricopeptide repeat protein [Pedobacter sp.]|nr:MAG: tetratricopeptide repeat protein [Pedobacter sp.]